MSNSLALIASFCFFGFFLHYLIEIRMLKYYRAEQYNLLLFQALFWPQESWDYWSCCHYSIYLFCSFQEKTYFTVKVDRWTSYSWVAKEKISLLWQNAQSCCEQPSFKHQLMRSTPGQRPLLGLWGTERQHELIHPPQLMFPAYHVR